MVKFRRLGCSGWVWFGLCFAILVGSCSHDPPGTSLKGPVIALIPGGPVRQHRGELGNHPAMVFSVTSGKDTDVHLRLIPEGRQDLVLACKDQRGRELISQNLGSWDGPEEIWTTLQASETLEVIVRRDGFKFGLSKAEFRLEFIPVVPSAEHQLRMAATQLSKTPPEELDSHFDKLNQALSLWDQVGEIRQRLDTQVHLGDALMEADFIDRALQAYLSAFKPPEFTYKALPKEERALWKIRLYDRVASVQMEKQDFPKALACYNLAIELATGLEDKTHLGIMQNRLGLLYFKWGLPEKGLSQHRAAERFLAVGESALAASNRLNQALSFSLLGEPELAIDLIRQARETFVKLHRTQDEVRTVIQLGWAEHLKSRGSKRALSYLREALKMARRHDYIISEAGALDRLGTVLRYSGQNRKSEKAYQRALFIYKQKKRADYVPHVHSNLSQLYFDMGRFEDGLVQGKKALAGFHESGPQLALAQLHFTLGRLNEELKRFSQAQFHFEKAIATIVAIQEQQQGILIPQSFQRTRQNYFDHTIDFLMTRFEKGHLKAGEEALATLERFRSMIWGAGVKAGREEKLTNDSDQLTKALAEVEAQLEVLQTHSDEQKLRRLIFEREQLLLANKNNRKKLSAPKPAFQLQHWRANHLRDRDVLVFKLSEPHSYLWCITPREANVYPLASGSHLERYAAQFRQLLTASPKNWQNPSFQKRWRQISRYLHDQLIPPRVASQLQQKQVAIVADGLLNLLSWSALLDEDDRYLVETREVAFLPFLTLVQPHQEKVSGAEKQGAFIFADPVYQPPLELTPISRKPTVKLHPLPYTRVEARDIAVLIPGPVTLFQGNRANRDLFLNHLDFSQVGILHFAVHAVSHPRYPELGGLVLSQWKDNLPIPATIFPHEIASLNLGGVEVNLSACQTSFGRQAGDGSWGLPQAFLLAGAHSVVATLWPLEDRATAHFQRQYYLHRQTTGALAALRETQLGLLGESRFSFPGFWAPFVLYQ